MLNIPKKFIYMYACDTKSLRMIWKLKWVSKQSENTFFRVFWSVSIKISMYQNIMILLVLFNIKYHDTTVNVSEC